MNVAMLHYHLDRGGVTQVVMNHLRALDAALRADRPWRVALVHSGCRAGWPEQLSAQLGSIRLDLIEIPGMGYDTGTAPAPDELAGRIGLELRRLGYSADDTLLHVHNHCLGKNLSLPGALRRLARDGFPLLLQIHDFAEDYRHENYARMTAALGSMAADEPVDLAALLYPQAEHVHYATLNQRDWSVLRGAGVPVSRLHLLPNAVPDPGRAADRGDARLRLAALAGVPREDWFLLYPVRCIRRKNVGEALLWAAVGDGRAHVGFTLPPLNPVERPSYLRWKQFAADRRLPCHFELGTAPGIEFSELRAAADEILTTSVTEGFGMVFLEPWLAGKTLVGRDLPEISRDFVASGLQLETLRPRLNVPAEWVDRKTFGELVATLHATCLESYGRPVPNAATLTSRIEEWLDDGAVDFARLDPALQTRVIDRVRDDPEGRRRLLDLNPWMEPAAHSLRPDATQVVQKNAEAVRRSYSLGACGRRLRDLYQAIAAAPRGQRLERLVGADQVLSAFLDVERFFPLRVLP